MSNHSSNQLALPHTRTALYSLLFEVAQEMGIQLPSEGYYGNMTTRETGAIGGHITRRLIQIAENSLVSAVSHKKPGYALRYPMNGQEGSTWGAGSGTGGNGGIKDPPEVDGKDLGKIVGGGGNKGK